MKLKFFGGSADDLSRPWMFKKDLLSARGETDEVAILNNKF